MNVPRLNEAIELHDSTLGRVEHDSLEVRIYLTPAYVHKSAGEPGVAPGTGWTQDAVLVIRDGVLEGRLPEMPCELTDGIIAVGIDNWRNCIPLPFEHRGTVKLDLVIMWGGEFTVRGKAIRVTLTGEPKYVEEVPGA
jgi:hypothetical protein